ncbi:hypothetical protein QSJ19_04385 [Gordonia sp. ABSL11-1]|uniref:hypothetical protein n=1 Tax=Gordonia sp. ABSL11-1 TaxID=3053924 RepID=UPI0025742763|nr:hypothetical protein [Gordonia sp. ABSL11-1]MDL9944832.1 hypothetical protein [Gordonia sp. ABSL11-1]
MRINDPKKTKTHAQFRVVNYTGSLPNLFVTLQKALPAKKTMSSQSIAVIDAGDSQQTSTRQTKAPTDKRTRPLS